MAEGTVRGRLDLYPTDFSLLQAHLGKGWVSRLSFTATPGCPCPGIDPVPHWLVGTAGPPGSARPDSHVSFYLTGPTLPLLTLTPLPCQLEGIPWTQKL